MSSLPQLSPNGCDHNELAREWVPHIRKYAEYFQKRLSYEVSVDDLLSAGLWGLFDAIRRFDAQKASFRTYAWIRIKGEMWEHCRAMDWVPHYRRTLQKKGLCQLPWMGRLQDIHKRISGKDDPTANMIKDEFWERIVVGCGTRKWHRKAFLMYFRDAITMREIGATLGKTESRVSQVCQEMFQQLQDKVGSDAPVTRMTNYWQGRRTNAPKSCAG